MMRPRATWIAAVLACGLMLTAGIGVVVAASAIGGGAGTFRTTRFEGERDASACQLDGGSADLLNVALPRGRLRVSTVFDCQNVIVRMQSTGRDAGFRFTFGGGSTYVASGSWHGSAPTDAPYVAVTVGRSSYVIPFRW